jgi:hypothetical protein
MPGLNITIPHNLTADEARTRIRDLMESLKSSYSDRITDLKESWDNNTGTFTFKAMGYDLSGKIFVTDSEVKITGDLPFAAVFFKGKIESTIRQKGEELLR